MPVRTGSDFRGNILDPSASPSARLVWAAAVSVAPFAAYPATYIQRVYPRNGQPLSGTSYWTGLFHADYVTVFTGTERYYGMHPYPDTVGGAIKWEISSYGGDTFTDAVAFNRWYTHVIITRTAAGTDFEDFYFDWPDQTKLIQTSGASKANAATPGIIIGDAPWNIGFENYKGVIRGLQFYDTNLSLAQVQNEIDNPGSFRAPWYINLNPTPTDVNDKSGSGHHPAWVGAASDRPTLWASDGVNKLVSSQQRMG